MSVSTDNLKKATELKLLPEFAQFVLNQHYEDFLSISFQLMHELNVPLLSYFSEIEARKLANISNTELLLYLAQNNPSAHIQKAIDRWKSDQLRTLKRNEIVVDDITRVGYSRKLAFLKFIPVFTNDANQVLELIKEIEFYILEYTSATFKAFVEIMDDRMDKHVQRLEESQALFKQAQALTHIGNYVWDLLSDKLTWSEELYRIYEVDPLQVEMTGATVGRYNHPEDVDMINAQIGNARETLQPFSFYYRILMHDGRIKILHAQGQFTANDEGVRTKMFGTAQDVTEQKETERKLLENQTFIQRIANAIPAIIASCNIHTGKYTFINLGLQKLLDYDPKHVMEEGVDFFTKLIHPDDLEPLMEKNNKALQLANETGEVASEPIVEFQYRMKHRNGEFRWFHTFGTVFHRNATGLVEQVLNISLDITERVKAENVLVQRTHELQQSNASLEEFAYVASHDLKEPLRKIAVFTDRLAFSTGQLTDDQQFYLDKIINGSIRMQQMIDDLLSLSLITADFNTENIDLEKLLQEVIQTFEYKIEDLKATITSDGLPLANIVPAQIRQLFQNLISNSLKFISKDERPVITVSHRYLSPRAVTEYNMRPARHYLEIRFADNGIGFEKEFEEKIFAVFHRLHHKNEYEGTGMGLAICKKIVQSNGGTILASGKPGRGSTFTVILPQ